MSFPKIIHQIWIQGENNIPDKFLNNIKQIKKLHETWEYYLWDEIKILELIHNDKELINKYYKFTYLHQKVDFAKIIILHKYGGIFIDIDAYTNKKLDDLFNKYSEYDFVISDLKNLGFIFNISICNKFTKCYNNGIFFSKKNANILKYIIDHFKTECSFLNSKIQCIRKTTGPLIFNNIINKYLEDNTLVDKSKIKVLNYDYMEPCTMNLCDITNNTYIIHKHENSWIDNSVKNIMQLYVTYYKLIHFILFVLIFILIMYIIKNSIH